MYKMARLLRCTALIAFALQASTFGMEEKTELKSWEELDQMSASELQRYMVSGRDQLERVQEFAERYTELDVSTPKEERQHMMSMKFPDTEVSKEPARSKLWHIKMVRESLDNLFAGIRHMAMFDDDLVFKYKLEGGDYSIDTEFSGPKKIYKFEEFFKTALEHSDTLNAHYKQSPGRNLISGMLNYFLELTKLRSGYRSTAVNYDDYMKSAYLSTLENPLDLSCFALLGKQVFDGDSEEMRDIGHGLEQVFTQYDKWLNVARKNDSFDRDEDDTVEQSTYWSTELYKWAKALCHVQLYRDNLYNAAKKLRVSLFAKQCESTDTSKLSQEKLRQYMDNLMPKIFTPHVFDYVMQADVATMVYDIDEAKPYINKLLKHKDCTIEHIFFIAKQVVNHYNDQEKYAVELFELAINKKLVPVEQRIVFVTKQAG